MSGVGRWVQRRREPVADCKVFTVERSIARSPLDGRDHDFYVIGSADFVQVVPVTTSGDVVLVRQYRHGSGTITLEVPGGLVDPGEDPAVAAARELLEETGYRAPTLEFLGDVNPNPALFQNRLHAYCAEGVERVGEVANDGNEHTVVELVPVGELPERLLRGDIYHALVAATLWRYWFMKRR